MVADWIVQEQAAACFCTIPCWGFCVVTMPVRGGFYCRGKTSTRRENPFSDSLVTAGQFHLTFWEVPISLSLSLSPLLSLPIILSLSLSHTHSLSLLSLSLSHTHIYTLFSVSLSLSHTLSPSYLSLSLSHTHTSTSPSGRCASLPSEEATT